MAHKGYQKGVTFEHQVKKHFENDGWFVVRSAGSHSPADLVCIKRGDLPTVVQCRLRGNLSADEERELSGLKEKYGCNVILAYRQDKELWFRNL